MDGDSVKPETYPCLPGDHNVNYVEENDYSLYRLATDTRNEDLSILATDHIQSCVGVLARDPETGDGFLAHTGWTDLDEEHNTLLQELYADLRDQEMSLDADITYVTGTYGSQHLLDSTRDMIQSMDRYLTVRSIETITTGDTASIACDMETGSRYTYEKPRNGTGGGPVITPDPPGCSF